MESVPVSKHGNGHHQVGKVCSFIWNVIIVFIRPTIIKIMITIKIQYNTTDIALLTGSSEVHSCTRLGGADAIVCEELAQGP